MSKDNSLTDAASPAQPLEMETDRAPRAHVLPTLSALAIMRLVLGMVCVGAIPAVICGHMARARIKASDGKLDGDGLALTGLILGYIGISVAILGVFAAVMTARFSSEDRPNRVQATRTMVQCICTAIQTFDATRAACRNH